MIHLIYDIPSIIYCLSSIIYRLSSTYRHQRVGLEQLLPDVSRLRGRHGLDHVLTVVREEEELARRRVHHKVCVRTANTPQTRHRDQRERERGREIEEERGREGVELLKSLRQRWGEGERTELRNIGHQRCLCEKERTKKHRVFSTLSYDYRDVSTCLLHACCVLSVCCLCVCPACLPVCCLG